MPSDLPKIYFASNANLYAGVVLRGSDGEVLSGGALEFTLERPAGLGTGAIAETTLPVLRRNVRYTVSFTSLPRCPTFYRGDSGSFTTGT